MTIRSAQTTIRLSMMNVVHDLSVLVARDEGLFREEGLDVDVIATAGTARANPVGEALHTKIFDRSLETLYNGGGLDQYRMCEWGVMKRTVEAVQSGQRPAKIVALGAAMTRMALVTWPERPLRARAAQGPADRGQSLQRVALHHPQDVRRVSREKPYSSDPRGHHGGTARGSPPRGGRSRQCDGAVDQCGPEAGLPRHHGEQFDAGGSGQR